MYYKNNRHGGNYRGGRRSFRRPMRRQKNFDPSHLVGKAVVEKKEEYVPQYKFSDFEISDRLKANIFARKYSNPTPIQDETIPAGLSGKDVIGIAKTGSGKTAGFLIPLIEKVIKDRSQKVLVIAPTRELAVQIEDELYIFGRNLNIISALCIGGVGMGGQINNLRKRPNFIIGTPGRLIDLERRGSFRFFECNSVVLDEVDRILDMGFLKDLRHILDSLPPTRQSFCFSATITENVEHIASGYLTDPVKITVDSNAPAANVDQEVVRLNGKLKVDLLHDLLVQEGFEKVLVFGRTKHGIERLNNELRYRGFKAEAIHGNKSQGQRQRALNNFKRNYIKILLATDVVARGVDVDDITHVINYDLPESYENYIHRIGRTGRAGKAGVAITLVP